MRQDCALERPAWVDQAEGVHRVHQPEARDDCLPGPAGSPAVLCGGVRGEILLAGPRRLDDLPGTVDPVRDAPGVSVPAVDVGLLLGVSRA